jgi:hypothetical protein
MARFALLLICDDASASFCERKGDPGAGRPPWGVKKIGGEVSYPYTLLLTSLIIIIIIIIIIKQMRHAN